MSHDFMAEFSAPVDWKALHDLTARSHPQLSFLPVPAECDGEKDALAISIAEQDRDAAAWRELQALLQTLRAAFAVEIIDLHTGGTMPL